jgi:hypothetical protein
MENWTMFEISIAVILAGSGAALRMLFSKSDTMDRRITTMETRLAVVNERTIEIFHRLERIEEKLDKLLTKAK